MQENSKQLYLKESLRHSCFPDNISSTFQSSFYADNLLKTASIIKLKGQERLESDLKQCFVKLQRDILESDFHLKKSNSWEIFDNDTSEKALTNTFDLSIDLSFWNFLLGK